MGGSQSTETSDAFKGGATDSAASSSASTPQAVTPTIPAVPSTLTVGQAQRAGRDPAEDEEAGRDAAEDKEAKRMMNSWSRNLTQLTRLAIVAKLGLKAPEPARSQFAALLEGKDVERVLEALRNTVDRDFYRRISYLVGVMHAFTELSADSANKLSDIAISDGSRLNPDELTIRNTLLTLDAARQALVERVEIAVQLLDALADGGGDVEALLADFRENGTALGSSLDRALGRTDSFYETTLKSHSELTISQAAATLAGNVAESQGFAQEVFELMQTFAQNITTNLANALVPNLQAL